MEPMLKLTCKTLQPCLKRQKINVEEGTDWPIIKKDL